MIRRTVTVSCVVAINVVLLIAGFAISNRQEARIVSQLDARIISLGNEVERLLEAWPGFEIGLSRTMAASPVDVRSLLVMRLDARGDVVGALPIGPTSDPQALPDVSSLAPGATPRTVSSADGIRYRAAAFGDEQGAIVIGLALTDADEVVQETRRILWVAGLCTVAVTGVLVWLIIRRGLRPVNDMISTAESIAEGNLEERAPVSDTDDEVGQLGRALNAMVDRLTEALAAKTASEAQMRQFVADASHELRTPLTSIRGYAELYRAGGGDVGRDAAVDRIEREARRMGTLVDELLLLARLDQGRLLAHDVFDVAAVVADAVDAQRVQSEMLIDLELPAQPAMVTGDAMRLRQVIDNLLVNVETHAGAGASAEVVVEADESAVTITVSDDGVGMTVDAQRNATRRFWQADPEADRQRGFGLGLAIADEIARANGGGLSISSAPSGGTRVVVTVPNNAPRTGAAGSEAADQGEQTARSPTLVQD